jgi:hypothetical protein
LLISAVDSCSGIGFFGGSPWQPRDLRGGEQRKPDENGAERVRRHRVTHSLIPDIAPTLLPGPRHAFLVIPHRLADLRRGALAESQARELAPLRGDLSAMTRAYKRAYDAAGKQPTAAMLRETVREYQQEQAERQQGRQDRAAARKQQERDAYIAEHGHAPEYMRLETDLRWLTSRAQSLAAKITAPGFDYTAGERAALADAIASLRDLLSVALEVLARQ